MATLESGLYFVVDNSREAEEIKAQNRRKELTSPKLYKIMITYLSISQPGVHRPLVLCKLCLRVYDLKLAR
jgi:hypothetical protein